MKSLLWIRGTRSTLVVCLLTTIFSLVSLSQALGLGTENEEQQQGIEKGTPEDSLRHIEKIIITRDEHFGDRSARIDITGDAVTLNGRPLDMYEADGLSVHIVHGTEGEGAIPAPREREERKLHFRLNRPRLGVTFMIPAGETLSAEGVQVDRVIPKSSAERAGIKTGDVITKLDGREVRKVADILRVIAEKKMGDTVEIAYTRGNESFTKSVAISNWQAENLQDMVESSPYRAKGYRNLKQDKHRRAGERFLRDRQPHIKNNPPPFKLGVDVETPEVGDGLRVVSVERGYPAESAGIKKGDVILKANKEPIHHVADLAEVIERSVVEGKEPSQRQITLEIDRSGSIKQIIISMKQKEFASL